ncbi:MAG TPA: 30S ribosomal protein S8e [Thermoplasmata archaeon]|nr:30S ribosomal protein S8e [Thermoplasmata archaeon]
MGIWQGRSRRKPTGGRLRPIRKKRRFEISRELQHATVGGGTVKRYRVRGGNEKLRILTAQKVNVYDPATRTTKVASIVTVRENPANPNYVQRNILTRGVILETDLGLVQIRSRPGQHGVLNGVRVAAKPATPP